MSWTFDKEPRASWMEDPGPLHEVVSLCKSETMYCRICGRVKAELEKLNGTRIKIGIQGNADSELLMIARVHEYGATITPKATRNLCIPIHKDSYRQKPQGLSGPLLYPVQGRLPVRRRSQKGTEGQGKPE